MNRNRSLVVIAVIVVLAAAGWFYFRSSHERVAFDLVKDLPTAKERRPGPEAFSVVQATINNQTKSSIFTKNLVGTRIKWEKTIPDNAWLNVSLGLQPEAWTQAGDGVLFRIAVSVGTTYDPLFEVQLNPYANAADRKWTDLSFDLSQYAGETVDIIFLTNASGPGKDDRNGDLALWGDPRIVVK